jgi:hypothetical protein
MNRKLAKILKNITEETKYIAVTVLESPTKWDLINFYHVNPFSIHTAKGLANMIGRNVDQIFEDAEELTGLKVLEKVCETGNASSIYAFEPASENAIFLSSLIELLDEDQTLVDDLLEHLK